MITCIYPNGEYGAKDVLNSGDIPCPPRPSEAYEWNGEKWILPIEKAKATKIAEIREHYEAQRAMYANALAGATEQATWAKQEIEARAFVKDSMAETPLIDALLAARNIQGETKTDLCNKIIMKADAYAVAIGESLGIQQSKEKQAESATTLDAITW